MTDDPSLIQSDESSASRRGSDKGDGFAGETRGDSEGHRKALRMRQMLNQAPFLVVIFLLLVAAVLVELDRWRRGGAVIGVAVIAAAVFRAALPTNRVGLLAVRGRLFDAVALTLVGAAILWVSWTINPLGTGPG